VNRGWLILSSWRETAQGCGEVATAFFVPEVAYNLTDSRLTWLEVEGKWSERHGDRKRRDREGGRQAEWKIEREGVIYWSEGGK